MSATETGAVTYRVDAKRSRFIVRAFVTRECVIEAQVIAGEDTLRASGEFPLRQSDFSIKPVSAAGGTIKLKDELKFSFDIVAHRATADR